MNDILQSAIQLKQAETESRRPKFKSAAQYYQSTLFHPEHVTMLRALPIHAKIQAGQRMHDVAKLFMDKALATDTQPAERREHLHKAQQEYESAYGLFVYMAPLSDEWKKLGVRDEHIAFTDTVGVRDDPKPNHVMPSPSADGETPDTDALDFVVKTLCHLSICLRHNTALKDVSLEALHEANRRDRWNLRAAFLLAKQLQQRSDSTSAELQVAVRALRVALDDAQGRSANNVPADHVASAKHFLIEMEEEQRRVSSQQKKTLQRFMESRPADDPATCPPAELRSSARSDASPLMNGRSRVQSVEPDERPSHQLQGNWFEQAEQARHAISLMEREGQLKEAAALQQKLNEAAAEKLFADFMLPKRCFDVNALAAHPDAEAFCRQQHIDPSSDQHLATFLDDTIRRHATQTLPMHLMSVLEVELMLFSVGLISTTELNDLDAKHRHNSYFISKTEGRGLANPKPLLGGMDEEEVEQRSRKLRAMLMQHLSRVTSRASQ
jgi:hypothetical protein